MYDSCNNKYSNNEIPGRKKSAVLLIDGNEYNKKNKGSSYKKWRDKRSLYGPSDTPKFISKCSTKCIADREDGD